MSEVLRLDDLYDMLVSGKVVLQASDPDSPIPSHDPEKINVFDFNSDRNDPLRLKHMFVSIEDDTLTIDWVTMGDYSDLGGMKDEFERWFNQFRLQNSGSTMYLKVNVSTRDGYGKTSFTIKRKDEISIPI